MAAPFKANTQLADRNHNGLIATQQANVADPGAVTDYVAVTNMTDPVAVAEGEAVSLALSVLADETIALRVTILAICDVLEEHGLMIAS